MTVRMEVGHIDVRRQWNGTVVMMMMGGVGERCVQCTNHLIGNGWQLSRMMVVVMMRMLMMVVVADVRHRNLIANVL